MRAKSDPLGCRATKSPHENVAVWQRVQLLPYPHLTNEWMHLRAFKLLNGAATV